MIIKIEEKYEPRSLPVLAHYDGQINPQPAYIALAENGRVWADYSGEIGGGVPMDVWNGRTLRWYISSYLSGADLNPLLDEIRPLLERVQAGHEVEWDGSNLVGRLTEDAQDASEQIQQICDDWEPTVEVYDVDDWLWQACQHLADHWPEEMDLDQAVAEVKLSIPDGTILYGDVKKSLLDKAEYDLAYENPLHEKAIQALLDDGRITDEDLAIYREATA